MKEIITHNFKKKADLIEHSPVPGEKENTMTEDKEWQYSYQLGRWMLVDKDD